MIHGTPKLADLQALMYRLITAPNGAQQALAGERLLQDGRLEAIISGDKRLSACERIEIYANAYFYRLLDIFKEDFPCSYAVLGDTNFHNLITGYLIEYPPTEPSVYYAGRHLPDYLIGGGRATRPFGQIPYLADLAQLERSSIEVFHSADAEALDQSSLRRLAPEAWPALRLRLHPAAQILDLEWRADTLLTAIREGRRWEAPEHRAVTILMWRDGWSVHYRALPPGERAALRAAVRGADFASICTEIASELKSEVSVTEVPLIINRMLASWLRDGILAPSA